MTNKKNVIHWGTFKYFYNKLQKNSFKNSFESKNFFWGKRICNTFPK